MNNDKRVYWVKLPVDFWTRPEVVMLLSQEHGAEMVVFFQRILAESANRNGYLRFTDSEAYTPEIFATLFRMDVQTVKDALLSLQRFGFIEIMDDKTIRVSCFAEFVGCETGWAEIKRKQREKEAKRAKVGQVEDNKRTMSKNVQKCPIDIERELDIEKEKDIDILKEKSKEKKRTSADKSAPTLEEIEQYVFENNKKVSPDVFFLYYESHGWKSIATSWQAAVDLWDARDRDKGKQKRNEVSAVTYMEDEYTAEDFAEDDPAAFLDDLLKGET